MSNPKKTYSFFFLTIIFIIAIVETWYTWSYIKNNLSAVALEQARIIARSIDVEDIRKLSGNSEDLTKYEYYKIKNNLKYIREGHTNCKFLYLMGKKNDNTVFFFVDSQPKESKDAVTPGLIYTEVSDEYIDVFNNEIEQTVGPIEDRWGRLVTSLVPIYDNKNPEKMIALFGMDIEVKDWYSMIFSQILFPFSASILILILIILLFLINIKNLNLKKLHIEKNETVDKLETALEDVKQLKGIIPICSNCKNIRDDKGYWKQIEKYISKHSEVNFTHSVCPDCIKILYPDLYEKKFKTSKN